MINHINFTNLKHNYIIIIQWTAGNPVRRGSQWPVFVVKDH